MTVVYCDFCAAKIPEDGGDPVTLGNPESIPDARKDACEDCFGKLWKLVKTHPGTPIPSLQDQLINQELLEACKQALGAFEQKWAINWDDLKRAIDKAEGRS
ncbi:MAG TPA: hypothetical protein VNH18_23510 [Bryobacteraceae bacterium]|nr:hypothetical protein [Blastocatellia bacterium]HXJ42267.1 hypothetical protein [Bryobacteraceae bacterium]